MKEALLRLTVVLVLGKLIFYRHFYVSIKGATAKVSCPKTFFLVNFEYINNVLNARVHV